MIGYCGIVCSACNAYKATLTADDDLMRATVEKFGDGKGTRNDWVCLGCLHPEAGLIAKYCASCGVRRCAVERAAANCAACPDHDGCEKLQSLFVEEGGDVAKRMRWLREAFVARTEAASTGGGGGAS